MAATADANINLTDVDFVGIKNSLKEFIGAKSTFKDYNFDGSAMSQLLDVLAYNTHYQAFYANMVANEMFLDSAVVRDSIVSHAKALGYTPQSTKAPKALVNVIFPDFDVNENSALLVKGSVFKGRLGDLNYNFVNVEDCPIDITTNIPSIQNLPVYEGSLRQMSFVKSTANPDQKFIIPQQQVDISHLSVRVQKSMTNNEGSTDVWTIASDINTITSTTKAFWIQEVKNGYYEIYFGDGVVGKNILDGNVIVAEYLITNASESNGIGKTDSPDNRAFTLNSGVASIVEVVSPADGGGVRESLSSIKEYAPRTYQAQDRAVTAEDYKSLIHNEYPTADSVFVWGGEDNNPPEYGKIFVSVKPKTGLLLTAEEKNYLSNTILKNKNIVVVAPEIKDPEYIFMQYNVVVNYKSSEIPTNTETFKILIKNNIKKWSAENLGKFNQNYRHSNFLTMIDELSTGILNTTANIKLQKRISPSLTNRTNYDIEFHNKIYHPHDGHMPVLETTPFVYKDVDGVTDTVCYMDDDGSGLIRMFKLVDGVKIYIYENVGTINYKTGSISLKQFQPVALSDNYITIRFTVISDEPNVVSDKNAIVYFDPYDYSALNVSLIDESIIVGHSVK